MIYARVFFYSRDAEIAFRGFILEHNPTRIRKFGRCLLVASINEDEHWFMGQTSFSKWSMGRTYIYVEDGKLYRSRYRLQMKGTDDEN